MFLIQEKTVGQEKYNLTVRNNFVQLTNNFRAKIVTQITN